jgi:formate C-acetyltransferase
LIVGNETSEQYKLPLYLEIATQWIKEGINNGFRDMLLSSEREELLKIVDYWEGKSIEDRWKAQLPKDMLLYTDHTNVIGHINTGLGKGRPFVNFETLFRIGLKGVIKSSQNSLKALEETIPDSLGIREHLKRKNFYKAVISSCQGVVEWSNRYAKLAKQLAANTTDEARRAELNRISEICKWVPENPPRTFHEALQFFYFIHLGQRLELIAHGAGYRFDQLMNQYYINDLKDGRITKEEALELLECLWLKIEDVGELSIPASTGTQIGALAWQNFTLGGIKEDGSDATNEMSYLMLDATMACRTREPALILRYHDKTPSALIDKALELISTGHGQPAFFNDNLIIEYLKKHYNIHEKVARGYSIPACVRWGIPGKSIHPMVPNVGAVSLLKCFELALNRGIDKFTGMQVGFPTADPTKFKSIDEVKEAYLTQVNFIAKRVSVMWNIAAMIYSEFGLRPFSSALIDDGLANGKESMQNIFREGLTVLTAGPTNVANSLAVIKKLIFKEKEVSMDTLIDALNKNWVGYEALQQKAIKNVPKFGNDDSYVDELMRWVHIESNRQFQKYTGLYGGRYTLASSIAAGYYSLSLGTGATPDGRRDGEASADATVSPQAGTDHCGPSAVLKSVANLSPLDTGWDHLFNQRFLPQLLSGKYREAFTSYLKTWSQLPIWHIQFNIVSSDTLKDAQRYPEKYSDLVVRVAGYSAYFNQLTEEIQNQIIERTEHSLS